jgi:hypothetical protein
MRLRSDPSARIALRRRRRLPQSPEIGRAGTTLSAVWDTAGVPGQAVLQLKDGLVGFARGQ